MLRTLSATLTSAYLDAVQPPCGDDGDRMYDEFERSLHLAMGAANVAMSRVVQHARRCLVEGWWKAVGTHSPEHWVTACCGLDWATARQVVTIARELGDYPRTAAAFAAGQLTIGHVLAIVTRIDPAHEREIASSAGSWTVAQVRRWSGNWPKAVDEPAPEPELEPEPAATSPDDADPAATPEPFGLPPADPTPSRADRDVFTGQWGDDGRFRGGFDLGATRGALLEQAIQSARRRVYLERRGLAEEPADDADDHADDVPTGAVSGAEALERLLHGALAGLDPANAAGQRPSDRYQVLVHLSADRPEDAHIHLGPLLTRAERDEVTCDADLVAVLWSRGAPVALGRSRRVVDPKRRALVEERDRCCRVRGRQGFLHIHHLQHSTRGGRTDLDNLFALCTRCHTAVHRGDIQVRGTPTTPDGLLFTDARGRPLPRPGPLPPPQPPTPPAPYTGPVRFRMPSAAYRRAA